MSVFHPIRSFVLAGRGAWEHLGAPIFAN